MDNLDDKIAHIESMRAIIGDAAADAAIAALRTETPTTRQSMAAEGGSIAGAGQASVGGDMRDSALGSGNLVLHHITIAPGGTLLIGERPTDLPPKPEAIRQALANYLRTLLERYQFLTLQGLGVGSSQQIHIALRAVFINLQTDVQISRFSKLLNSAEEDTPFGVSLRFVRPTIDQQQMQDILAADPDMQQWLDELLTVNERALLFDPDPTAASDQGRLISPEIAIHQRLLAPRSALELIRQRLLAPRSALELIRHHRALVLLGDPGSGKSTVLRYLTLVFALARLQADSQDAAILDSDLAWSGSLPLPILIQLRRFADELTAAPADAGPLLDHIERMLNGDRLEVLAQHLHSRLELGEVLLMCDGLDEVANDTRRAWAAQAVALFQSRFPHSRVVLTSRIYAYRAPCQLPHPFQVATLQPLDVATQDAFILRWYHAALLQGSGLTSVEQRQEAKSKARDLSAALERRPRLREIAANPLLLTMMALVHQHRLRLPQQRARLYEECLTLLLEQWEQRRAGASPAGLAATLGISDQTDRLPLIQPIAYQLQVLGREEARQNEIRDWLLPRFIDLGGDKASAQALIDRMLAFLEGRSGLLIARDIKDYYTFPHRTFQEYLAARELIFISQGNQNMREEVIARRHAAPWHEVILLIAGHLVTSGFPQEARALAWALLEADQPGSPGYDRSAVLAGEIVEELESVPGREGQHLKADVTARLVELVQNGRLPAKERVEAAFLLGRLGDPRMLDLRTGEAEGQGQPSVPSYWCAVEAGPFWYGDDRENQPLTQVTLPYDFRIARYPVTNAEYRRFIEDGGYDPHRPWWTEAGRAWLKKRKQQQPSLWENTRYNGPTQPVVSITWYEAAAYCNWLTRAGHQAGWLPKSDILRLPTSLEWERAARHTDKRRYPWGRRKPDPERANYDESEIGRPAPVGCFPAGVAVCGAHDMVGNVMEWLATPWDSQQTVEAAKDFTDDKTIAVAYNDFRVRKEQMCCGARNGFVPYDWIDYRGFRVLWSGALIV